MRIFILMLALASVGCSGNAAKMEAIEKTKIKLDLAESDLVKCEEWFEEFGETPKSKDPEELQNYKVMNELRTESQQKIVDAKAELRKLVD